MNSVYCTAPWNGLTVREDGSVKTCCVGGTTLGNLNNQKITEILSGSALQNIRQEMLSGCPGAENCKDCVEQEQRTGLTSLRQHYIKFYPEFDVNNITLNVLDIRWNNSCNLGCLYCSPVFSSTWSEREKVVNLRPVKPYQDELLEFIMAQADTVKEIMLVGGEPMLMKQNYRLLRQLPLTTKISVITNLSYDLKNLPCFDDLLLRPKENLLWNVSLENTHSQFEYVRSGADWKTIEENIKLINHHWPDSITVAMVYSMFSAFDLVETVDQLCQLGVKKFSFQTYFGNPTMDVFRMPQAIKTQALGVLEQTQELYTRYLQRSVHPDDQQFYSLQNIDFIKQHLLAPADAEPVTREQFTTRLQWYNQWGSTQFETLWPHVIDLVNQHLA